MNADEVLLLRDASVYLIPAFLIVFSCLIFKFANHDLKKDLQEWMKEEIPLHPYGDIEAKPVLGPASQAISVELTPEFLLARIDRNNDGVATATSGIALALSHAFISESTVSPALSAFIVVLSFLSFGLIIRSRPMQYRLLSFGGFGFSSLIFIVVYFALAVYTILTH